MHMPMTPQHIQKLQQEFQDYQYFCPRIRTHCKSQPYRTVPQAILSSDTTRPSSACCPVLGVHPNFKRYDRILNFHAAHEAPARCMEMLDLSRQPTLPFHRDRRPPNPPASPNKSNPKPQATAPHTKAMTEHTSPPTVLRLGRNNCLLQAPAAMRQNFHGTDITLLRRCTKSIRFAILNFI